MVIIIIKRQGLGGEKHNFSFAVTCHRCKRNYTTACIVRMKRPLRAKGTDFNNPPTPSLNINKHKKGCTHKTITFTRENTCAQQWREKTRRAKRSHYYKKTCKVGFLLCFYIARFRTWHAARNSFVKNLCQVYFYLHCACRPPMHHICVNIRAGKRAKLIRSDVTIARRLCFPC